MSGRFARRWLTTFIADFNAGKDRLGELDRLAGDGDFAVNLGQALKRVQNGIAELSESASAGQVFGVASNGFLNTGGTSGPLLGMWLRDVAKAWTSEALDPVSALADGIANGTATVQRLGGAHPGDRTMVDAMLPAAAALQQARQAGLDLGAALAMAAAAANQGAAQTAGMTAALGRASYVGDAAAGVIDAGAAAIALFFASGHRACAV